MLGLKMDNGREASRRLSRARAEGMLCRWRVAIPRRRHGRVETGTLRAMIDGLLVSPAKQSERARSVPRYATVTNRSTNACATASKRSKGKRRMIRVVSWNISKRKKPWRELAQMARKGEADVALLQEAGSPPDDVDLRSENEEFWKRCGRPLYDRRCMVVQLSDRVDLEWFRSVPPVSELGEHELGVSGIGTIAAARVAPHGRPKEDAFTAM